MYTIDEIKDYQKYISITWVDMLDCLGRVADMKSLPKKADLEAAGEVAPMCDLEAAGEVASMCDLYMFEASSCYRDWDGNHPMVPTELTHMVLTPLS